MIVNPVSSRKPRDVSGRQVRITVVVCTYNRCESLVGTLTSLGCQKLPESVEWEVVVVDNNSNDRTRQVVQEFQRSNPERFRYGFEPRPGKSIALNTGIREARGEVIAFTDDDVTMQTTWLNNLTAGIYSGECAGAGGRTLPQRDFVPPDWLAMERQYALAPLALFDLGAEAQPLKVTPFRNNMALR